MDIEEFKKKYSPNNDELNSNKSPGKLMELAAWVIIPLLCIFWLVIFIFGAMEGFSLALSASVWWFKVIFVLCFITIWPSVFQSGFEGALCRLVLVVLATKFILNFFGYYLDLHWLPVIAVLLSYAFFELARILFDKLAKNGNERQEG